MPIRVGDMRAKKDSVSLSSRDLKSPKGVCTVTIAVLG